MHMNAHLGMPRGGGAIFPMSIIAGYNILYIKL